MSDAAKCDRCDALFEPTIGCVVIESICVVEALRPKSVGNVLASWAEIDLCAECSDQLLKVLFPALQGVDKDGDFT